jgi:hypothetical protein
MGEKWIFWSYVCESGHIHIDMDTAEEFVECIHAAA